MDCMIESIACIMPPISLAVSGTMGHVRARTSLLR